MGPQVNKFEQVHVDSMARGLTNGMTVTVTSPDR